MPVAYPDVFIFKLVLNFLIKILTRFYTGQDDGM